MKQILEKLRSAKESRLRRKQFEELKRQLDPQPRRPAKKCIKK